jgi:integrase
MAKPTVLTDRKVTDLPVPAKGKRRMVYDALCPGLLVRCYDSGKRTWMLAAAFPPQRDITRRQLGIVGQLLIEDARAKARRWLAWIDQGLDPAVMEENERRANTEQQTLTVAVLAEDFIERRVRKQRQATRTEREIRNEIVPVLGKTPVRDVTRQDVVKLCEVIADRREDTTGPAYHAHTIFGHIRAIFNFGLDKGTYNLERSPCDRLRPSSFLGAKQPRQRLLDADEVKALWAATGKMGYPAGPMYRALLLSGCRLEEVAHAHWQEIKGNTLVIPAERFKSGAQHEVPLTPALARVLEDCPVFKSGGFLFSATWGKTPIQNFGRQKARLDKLMLAELRTLRPWKNHDVRHFTRSTLSRLRFPEHIIEQCIGHGRKGLARVYDHHKFSDEIREAMTAYSEEVLRLVGEKREAIKEAAE